MLYDFKQGKTAAESHRILSKVFENGLYVSASDGFNASRMEMRSSKTKNVDTTLKL